MYIFLIYRRMQDFAVLDSIPDILYPKVLPSAIVLYVSLYL